MLRVAASLHILFSLNECDDDVIFDGNSTEISEKAVEAAIDFVALCLKQTAFIAGRGEIDEEIQILKLSK